LGLASAYGIVKNHAGFINVYSEIGHGSTFTIYLPASEKALKEAKKDYSEEIPRGTETVLLVDDEMTITGVIEKALILMGYKVFLASDGEKSPGGLQKKSGHDRAGYSRYDHARDQRGEDV